MNGSRNRYSDSIDNGINSPMEISMEIAIYL